MGGDEDPSAALADCLLAGAAVYNEGTYGAARATWGDRWLGAASGTPDERLLHGLAGAAAAVRSAREGDWERARERADEARAALDAVPEGHRDVSVGGLAAYLQELAGDPGVVERRDPPSLQVGGETPTPTGLPPNAALVAAVPLAETLGYDVDAVARAVGYVRADRAPGQVVPGGDAPGDESRADDAPGDERRGDTDASASTGADGGGGGNGDGEEVDDRPGLSTFGDDEESGRFLSLVVDFVRDREHRGVVHQRLVGHVERRTAKEEDVAGLFD